MCGGKIYDNDDMGVQVTNGPFTMHGGEISGNKGTKKGGLGGGVVVYTTFTMNGGKISGNTSSFNQSGGGVAVHGGTFTMNGGEISGNATGSDYGYGGGVFVNDGAFIKTGGIIYGKDGTANENKVDYDIWGHAVFYAAYPNNNARWPDRYYRDTTLSESDNISTKQLPVRGTGHNWTKWSDD
jgi:hypothetical protein